MKTLNRLELLNALKGMAATLDEAEVTLHTVIAQLRDKINDHIVQLLKDEDEDDGTVSEQQGVRNVVRSHRRAIR